MMANIAVERDQRRPVAFHGDEGKAPFLDQAARQGVAPGVKLPGAVGSLAEQHPAGVADGVEQGSQVVGLPQRLRQCAQGLWQFLGVGTRKPNAAQADEQCEQDEGIAWNRHGRQALRSFVRQGVLARNPLAVSG